MTAGEQRAAYLRTACDFMVFSTDYDDDETRDLFERVACKFFKRACELGQTAQDGRSGSHASIPGGGGRDAHNAQQA